MLMGRFIVMYQELNEKEIYKSFNNLSFVLNIQWTPPYDINPFQSWGHKVKSLYGGAIETYDSD